MSTSNAGSRAAVAKGQLPANPGDTTSGPPVVIPIPPPDRDLKARIERAREEAAKSTPRTRFLAFLSSRRLMALLVVVLIAAAAWGIPYLFWLKAPELPLKIAIVDKTVPFKNRREHKGLFWALGQNKFMDPSQTGDQRWYDLQNDYVGFDPINPPEKYKTTFITDSLLADRDLIYLCDTYGVYRADYTQFTGDFASTIHSPVVFGGLTAEEMTAISNFAKRGKTVVAEFNTCASPTDPAVRAQMEQLLGVTWTRWIGRYFSDFRDEKDVPHWLYELYQKKYQKEWDVTGSGYMLCREETEDFIILKDGIDVRTPGLEFRPVQGFNADVMQGVKPCNFTYWFDVVTPMPKTEVLAEFQFTLSDSGLQKLKEKGLSPAFPALCRSTNGHQAYYSSGELVDFDRSMGPPNTRLTLYINRSFYNHTTAANDAVFYWYTAYPLITNILRRESYRITQEPKNIYLWK